ncbi:MAG: protein kinase [Chloroflexi bacterium]|nr:protein kinase [Chloroflexota bacterium]
MSTVPQRLGKYELRKLLGKGNVAEVWLAYDLLLKRDVALKIIHADLQADPNFFTRFVKEGQNIAALHHTNIVQMYDATVFRPSQGSNATAYIVKQYIKGRTLADYIKATSRKGNLFPLTDIVYLFTSLGVAIDYAHQRGIVHGNIKQSNILLNEENIIHLSVGEPVLTDFSLADMLGQDALVVSPFYMSPEQAKGQVAGKYSDIYSLGVILYELCTGVQPFRDRSSVAVMMHHIDALPTPPLLINPNLPPALSAVILRALSKEPKARFSMASLLAVAIADACSLRPSIPQLHTRADMQAYHTGPRASLLGVPQPLWQSSASMPAIRPTKLITGEQATVRPMPLALEPVNRASSSAKLPAIPTSPHRAVTTSTTAKLPAANTSQPQKAMAVPTAPRLPVPDSTTTGTRLPVPVQTPMTSPPTPMPPSNWGRERSRASGVPMSTVIIALLLLLLVVVSALATSLLLNVKGQTNAGSMVGQVFFQDDALGHEDVLRLELKNIMTPPQGKMYVAWLQDSTHHLLPLGPLSVHDGAISFVYFGDAQHTNLLSIAQGVVITQENAGALPSTSGGQIVFQAHFDSASLPYLKNILYTTPNFPSNQGVARGLLDAIKSLNDKAGSIVDTLQNSPHDYALARRQAVRIIELVDGTQYAMSSGDLPADVPSEIGTPVGLLTSPTQPGYLDTLTAQLDALQAVSGSNTLLRQHIQNVRNAMSDLQDWVQKIRLYDVQLVKAADLSDPTIIGVALQMKSLAADSYTGRTIPPNEGPLPSIGSAGAYQAYVESQYMATLDLKQV